MLSDGPHRPRMEGKHPGTTHEQPAKLLSTESVLRLRGNERGGSPIPCGSGRRGQSGARERLALRPLGPESRGLDPRATKSYPRRERFDSMEELGSPARRLAVAERSGEITGSAWCQRIGSSQSITLPRIHHSSGKQHAPTGALISVDLSRNLPAFLKCYNSLCR